MVDYEYEDDYVFVPFAERDGVWDDIEPVEQYEGGQAPIAPIPYKKEYSDVMGYFRAILKKDEISKRALNLTEEVIYHSEGNYQAWHYRRKLLEKLSMPLKKEMEWLQDIGLDKEKNFQIWHHRRCIVEILGDVDMNLKSEMEFLNEIFDSDRKNYHAWSYRIWLIERFQLWENELDFVDKMLSQDRTNNSVWSYRYFIINRAPTGLFKQHAPGSFEFVNSELEIVMKNWLPKDFSNEACWVYLRGFFCNTEAEEVFSQNKPVKRICINKFRDILLPFFSDVEQTIRQYSNQKSLRHLLPCLIDLHLSQGDSASTQQAINYLEELRDSVDKIRANYWQWKINKLGDSVV